MKIPSWIWIIIGLSALPWVIPEGIAGERFILPVIAIGGSYSSHGSTGVGPQGLSSFYDRFRKWGVDSSSLSAHSLGRTLTRFSA